MELVGGWRIGPGESKKQNKGLTGWKHIYSLGECSEGTGQELLEHRGWYVYVSLGELGTFHRIGSVDLRGKVGKSIQAGGIAYAKTLKLEVSLFRDPQVISSSVSGRKSIGGRQRMEWEVLTPDDGQPWVTIEELVLYLVGQSFPNWVPGTVVAWEMLVDAPWIKDSIAHKFGKYVYYYVFLSWLIDQSPLGTNVIVEHSQIKPKRMWSCQSRVYPKNTK